MDDATKEDLLAILNEKEDEIEWLKAELDEANHSRELSDAECVTLRNERDEARREVMLWMSERSSTSEMTAEYKKRGWEYLKDNP